MSKYYVRMVENGEPLTGDIQFNTLAEATKKAKQMVDDTCPYLEIQVLQVVATAYLGGDGESYLKEAE